MNRPITRRSSSHASRNVRPQRRSNPEDETSNPNAVASGRERVEQQTITEEIAEIKRYEDFTTIDWVQDAAREQIRRQTRRRAKHSERLALRAGGKWWAILASRIRDLYDAGQAWFVVTLVGIAIGLNAAFLSIITEWLSDMKLGYCTTAFYLNENFCCFGEEGGCPEWKRWSSWSFINYLFYFVFAIIFSFTSAVLVKAFAPYAAGSGISEIKCIIAGFVMKGFLGFWTLLIKSITLPLAIASGLSVGKEGPSVHYAVCTGNVISRFFEKYKRNAAKTREILSACAAAGVAVAFGSPIGGVLFSLEEMSSQFPLKTLWRSYFCALVATAVLSAMNPFRTGQLVMFQVHYDRSWHFFEVIFFLLLGLFGGLYGAFVIKWNLKAQAFRKKHLSQYAVPEAVVLAGLTALICYPNMFLRIDMTENMEVLFHECEGTEDYAGICERSNRTSMLFSLAMATIIRTLLVIISYGCKVPAGIFVPSMAIGASFGRFVGILVQALYEAFPNSRFFAACEPDVPCITPGTYAFLGAAAALSGIMHITVSVVVIMFELTGALTYILPTMIVVGVTKAVSTYFPPGGIADRMIYFNGFPFLDNKEEHNFNVTVSKCMTSAAAITTLPASGITFAELESLLTLSTFRGFPILAISGSQKLVGYIGRTELGYAITKMRQEGIVAPNAICNFSAANSTGRNRSGSTITVTTLSGSDRHEQSGNADFPHPVRLTKLDFSRYVDNTPLTVNPRQALETVMEIFQKLGPRVILVEQAGQLEGLVTIKDCLKYQLAHEASSRHAHGSGNSFEMFDPFERMFVNFASKGGEWISDRVSALSRGRIRLRSMDGDSTSGGLIVGESVDPRDYQQSLLGQETNVWNEAALENDAELELTDRV